MIYFSCLALQSFPKGRPEGRCLLSSLQDSSCGAVPGARGVRASRAEKRPWLNAKGPQHPGRTAQPRCPRFGAGFARTLAPIKRGCKSPLFWSPFCSGSPHLLSRQPSARLAQRRSRSLGQDGRGTTSCIRAQGPGTRSAAPPTLLPAGWTLDVDLDVRLLPGSTAILALSATSSPCFSALLSERR